MKGRYASVESILELSGDRVEWRMAVSSSPGGLIPQFISDSVVPQEVSKVESINFIGRFATDAWPGCVIVLEVDAGEQG